MSLKTYTRELDPTTDQLAPWPFVFSSAQDDLDFYDNEPVPGCWVRHKRVEGKGMVVACSVDQLVILWSEEPAVDIDFFKRFTMPLVRRVFPPSLAPQLVSIQPMTAPVGSIFYMDYSYGDSSPKWKRCNTGPKVCRVLWRAGYTAWESIRQFGSSLVSWSSSWRSSGRTSASAGEQARSHGAGPASLSAAATSTVSPTSMSTASAPRASQSMMAERSAQKWAVASNLTDTEREALTSILQARQDALKKP